MKVGAVVERVERISTVRVDGSADRSVKESALVAVRKVRAWLDASEADLAADGTLRNTGPPSRRTM